MTNLDNRGLPDERPVGSLTGLTPEAAKEFHGVFLLSFIVFTVIAILAHIGVWTWRPWAGDYAAIQGATELAQAALTTMLS